MLQTGEDSIFAHSCFFLNQNGNKHHQNWTRDKFVSAVIQILEKKTSVKIPSNVLKL